MVVNKRYLRFSELKKSKRNDSVQRLKKLKKEIVKGQMELLEDFAKEEAKRPLTISEAEKAALIILESNVYTEKEVENSVDYLRNNLGEVDKLDFSEKDLLKISIMVSEESKPEDSPADSSEIAKPKKAKAESKKKKGFEKKPTSELKEMSDKELLKYAKKYIKKSAAVTENDLAKEYPELAFVLHNKKMLGNVIFTKEQVEKIKEQLKKARDGEGIPNRSALALLRGSLHSSALAARVLDEVYPEMERSKAGERQKYIQENLGSEDKIRKIVEENNINSAKDFMCKLEYGASIYGSNGEVRRMLRKVLEERAAKPDKPAVDKPTDAGKGSEGQDLPADGRIDGEISEVLESADKKIEKASGVLNSDPMAEFTERVKSFYNEEDTLRNIIEQFGVKSEQSFITNVPFGEKVFNHPEFNRELLTSLLDEMQAAGSILVTTSPGVYLRDKLTKLNCPEDKMEEGIERITSKRRIDMGSENDRRYLNNEAISFVARLRVDKRMEQAEAAAQAYKSEAEVKDLDERGFFVSANDIQKIADDSKLGADEVRMHILSIIAGLKLGTPAYSIGSNGTSKSGLSESIVIKNIRHRIGRSDVPKSRIKPRNILRYLCKKGILARGTDKDVYSLESDSDKIDPVWRSVVSDLINQNRERRNSQY